MAACKSVNVDSTNYVSSLFTLKHIFNVYDNSFGLLPDESLWAEYKGNQWCHDPTKRRSAKGRPKSNRIPTEMDDQIEGDNTKKCRICQQPGHNRKNCPNIPSSLAHP